MIRTHILPCALPHPVADALNLASGRIYTQVLVSHWRVVRHKGSWLSEKAGLAAVLRVLEVRLVYDKRAQRYTWHVVVENGMQPKPAPGFNIVSVDLGEIHPAVVGDAEEATLITCRARRHEQQGHAKRLAKITRAIIQTTKGSRRHTRLLRSKSRMKAKHTSVLRDMEHKISRAIVGVAVERLASTIVLGDVRDVADGVNHGAHNNQKISGWSHGKIRTYVEYKAQAEGIRLVLQDVPEGPYRSPRAHYTSQTCPRCGHRHKPRGRVYTCGQCGFSGHRDVVGQINILSAYLHGAPGKLSAPAVIKQRRPALGHGKRSMRRCQDIGQVPYTCSLETDHA